MECDRRQDWAYLEELEWFARPIPVTRPSALTPSIREIRENPLNGRWDVTHNQPMDPWEFAAALVGALAWPSAVLVLGLIFKSQVRSILSGFASLFDDRVEEASLGRDGAKVKRYRKRVKEELAEAQESLSAESAAAQPSVDTSPFLEEISMLADINPAAAIASAAARLEVSLRDLVKGASSDAGRMSLGRLIDACARNGLLTAGEARAAQYLAHLRNAAVHQNVASEGEALEFAALARRVAAAARLESGLTSIDGADPL